MVKKLTVALGALLLSSSLAFAGQATGKPAVDARNGSTVQTQTVKKGTAKSKGQTSKKGGQTAKKGAKKSTKKPAAKPTAATK